MYYVYSLKCKDGYYVGCTNNIQERVERHKNGNVPATTNRLPVTLEFYFATEDRYKAFEFEKYLKSGSGRAFIGKHLSEPSKERKENTRHRPRNARIFVSLLRRYKNPQFGGQSLLCQHGNEQLILAN